MGIRSVVHRKQKLIYSSDTQTDPRHNHTGKKQGDKKGFKSNQKAFIEGKSASDNGNQDKGDSQGKHDDGGANSDFHGQSGCGR